LFSWGVAFELNDIAGYDALVVRGKWRGLNINPLVVVDDYTFHTPTAEKKDMSPISSLVESIAQSAHAHVSALLASTQAQPGDKLPLNEKVKENEAGKPIALAPTGRNIFVRIY
jgi:hypothetical protein